MQIIDGSLTPSTTYAFRVRTNCSGDISDVTDYSELYYFTTEAERLGASETSAEIFPNPNTGEFTLMLNGCESKNYELSIIS
jgi:hypothetical protein